MVRSITSLSLASLQARRWREFFKVLEPKKKKKVNQDIYTHVNILQNGDKVKTHSKQLK